jgi:GNAT superfamily N-acetyltransferase
LDIRQDLQRDREAVLKKHPELAQIKLESPALSPQACLLAGSFIERCWTEEYGLRPRISFAAEFLEAHFNAFGNGQITIARNDAGIVVGTFLAFDLRFEVGGRSIRTALMTGLTTDRAFRGQGIAEWVRIQQMETLVELGYEACIQWFNAGYKHRGSSYREFAMRKASIQRFSPVRIYAKSLDIGTAVRLGKLGAPKRMAARGIDFLFPVRAPSASLNMALLGPENAEEVLAAIGNMKGGKKCPLAREWRTDDFRLRCGDDRYIVLGLRSSGSDELLGVVWGYRNPVCNGEAAYLAVDGIAVSSDAPWRTKRALMAGVEHYARESLNCFSVVAPANVSTISLLGMGYIPYTTQILSLAPFSTKLSEALPEHIHAPWAELR